MLKLFSLDNQQPHNTLPFNDIPTQKLQEFITEAITEAKVSFVQIKTNPDAPTFENTIVALDRCGIELERASGMFFNLFNACTDEHLDAAANDVSAKLSEYGNDIQLDPDIFKRIKTVYENQAKEKLSQEQTALLEKYYLDFTRNGALLNNDDKETLRSLDEQLSQLNPVFSQNLLKATNAFTLIVENEADIAPLPESSRAAAKELAQQKGDESHWHFTLQAPSYIPFMTYCPNEELRQQMWMAYNTRASNGETDNTQNCHQLSKLRAQRAQLLGFNTHADFILSRRMAKNSQTVYQFINKLLPPSKAAAEKDVEAVSQLKKKEGSNSELNPWDFAYYSEKLKQQTFAFSEEDLRPYFQLEKVVAGAFAHAYRLFNLNFKERKDVQVYHPDVQVFEVTEDDKHIGLLYIDLFPRDNKKGGAWMTSYLEQGSDQNGTYRPHISIVCNFTKPTAQTPALLTFMEVETFFHEFGHALHGLLSECHYSSVSGTNVLWDFVELPSQIMENWCTETETLKMFAQHYKTGEDIPGELIEKLKRSQKFLAGYASLRQLSFCSVDLAWHDVTPDKAPQLQEVEEGVLSTMSVLPRVPGTSFSVGFSHIFAGGYSAGYYSYKWAEVLDADAFEFFKEKGIYDKEVAQRFRSTVLSRGGSVPPDELYRQFRGRDPSPEALLRRSGLMESTT